MIGNMKRIKKASILASAILALSDISFGHVTITTSQVGNPGNAPDADGFGSVGYVYSIGTYDVTASQYCAFLNAVAANDVFGAYSPSMAGATAGNPGIVQSGSDGSYTYSVIDGRGNYPVTDVDFWNATRFANWLDNGQPNGPEGAGTTETGTYDLLATTMDAQLEAGTINKNNFSSSQADDNSVVRSGTAVWAITSENEWYKAAYYDPNLNSGAGGYYFFPIQSNNASNSQMNTDGADTTPVGSYPYPSYYGTYDQGGNVYQWNETITNGYNVRGMRGGDFANGGDYGRANSSESTYIQPFVSYNTVGFRVTYLGPQNLTWANSTGAGDGKTWDIGANANWNNGSGIVTYSDGGNVVFDDSSANTQPVVLNTIVSPNSVTVNTVHNSYAITGTGSIAGSGSLTLASTNSSAFTLETSNSYTGGTYVNGGMLVAGVNNAIPPNGSLTIGANGAVQLANNTGQTTLSSLSITGGGTFEIGNNNVVISDPGGSIDSTIRSYLASGYNGGRWNGAGIDTTAPTGARYGIGWADGAVGGISGITSGQLEIKYTLLGDANLDGAVNGADFNILAANFNQSITGWDQGAFNYDGLVNATDFLELAANFNQGVSGGASAGDVAALDAFAAANGLFLPTSNVPEPASAGMMVMAASGILRRRRRSSCHANANAFRASRHGIERQHYLT